MAAYGGILESIASTMACFALEDDVSVLNSPVSTDSTETKGSTDSAEIQQVSWSQMEPPLNLTNPSTAVVSARSLHRVVRDDAPSSTVVIACLVGFGLLSVRINTPRSSP